MLLGYRTTEVGLKAQENYEAIFNDSKLNTTYPKPFRSVEQVSLGMNLENCALPHPDTSCPFNLKEGVIMRVTKPLPRIRHPMQYWTDLRTYTKEWLDSNLKPLPLDYDTTFATWLENVNQPPTRKLEYKRIHEEVINPLYKLGTTEQRTFLVSLFMKDENYVDFKAPRGIYARDDVAKVFFGPWFKAIESELYHNPSFIKHVPVAERGEYIIDMLHRDGAKYIQTDYSSFECHFTPERMENCEFMLYEYMLSNLPFGDVVIETMRTVLQGVNFVKNRNFSMQLLAHRMSGEMNTSLGNGFFNLMQMNYFCRKLKVPCIGVVEGDDGLFMFSDIAPKTQDYTDVGCLVKLEAFDELSKASFCGLLFDVEAKQLITDPRKVLASFGWTSKKYCRANEKTKKMLLRAKSLSLLVQYPCCPIITQLALKGLELTAGVDIRRLLQSRNLDMWQRERLQECYDTFNKNKKSIPEYLTKFKPISIYTRLLVEELYGFSIVEQELIECKIKNMTKIEPINLDVHLDLFPESWKEYFANYNNGSLKLENNQWVDCYFAVK
jgi:hypothetical protein